jgi:hypothetical protein
VEYYLLLCFRRSSGILYNYCTWMRSIWGFMEQSTFCTMFYYTRFLKILKFHEIFWIFLKILEILKFYKILKFFMKCFEFLKFWNFLKMLTIFCILYGCY